MKIDRGSEFTAGLTVQACHRHGLKQSMGDTEIRWDKSPVILVDLQHESYYRHVYATKAELVAAGRQLDPKIQP
ncbi:hypothetical protein IU427_29930 [Nocardia beijingensis]|uniref:hypothetical protein n=1 Tax=Nocardia beijingensis TaxID=95162 RepID=UPI0018947EA9|nr:hypothetical protein [Nocardia beijingensis]MBF6469356.1 hypothetical protein [Nocardia beijingensis]